MKKCFALSYSEYKAVVIIKVIVLTAMADIFAWSISHYDALLGHLEELTKPELPWNQRGRKKEAYEDLTRFVNENLAPFKTLPIRLSTLESKVKALRKFGYKLCIGDMKSLSISDLGVRMPSKHCIYISILKTSQSYIFKGLKGLSEDQRVQITEKINKSLINIAKEDSREPMRSKDGKLDVRDMNDDQHKTHLAHEDAVSYRKDEYVERVADIGRDMKTKRSFEDFAQSDNGDDEDAYEDKVKQSTSSPKVATSSSKEVTSKKRRKSSVHPVADPFESSVTRFMNALSAKMESEVEGKVTASKNLG